MANVRKALYLEPDLWKRVEDYRFAARLGSENDAMRALLEKGLGHEEKRLAKRKPKASAPAEDAAAA